MRNDRTAPMPAREVNVDALQQRMEAGEHQLLCDIGGTRAFLDALVDQVVERLERIGPLTTQFCDAFARRVDTDSLAADLVREELEDRLGITALWQLADRIRDAHPEEPPRGRAD
jgi:hypothetical protein